VADADTKHILYHREIDANRPRIYLDPLHDSAFKTNLTSGYVLESDVLFRACALDVTEMSHISASVGKGSSNFDYEEPNRYSREATIELGSWKSSLPRRRIRQIGSAKAEWWAINERCNQIHAASECAA
jgi:hypothetical protein